MQKVRKKKVRVLQRRKKEKRLKKEEKTHPAISIVRSSSRSCASVIDRPDSASRA